MLQILASGIAAHALYREATESSFDDIFKLARSILENGRLLPIHYAERASILENLPFLQDAITIYTRNIKRLNANCNVAHLAKYLFKSEPSYVFNKSCTCGITHSHQSTICNININILLQEGLQNIQRAIDDAKNLSFKCQTCSALTNSIFNYEKQILIDTTVFTDNTYINRNPNIKHNFNTIAKTITLNDKIYILVGVVHYISYGSSRNGHYISFAFAGTHWYIYDDLKKNVK